MRSLLSAFFRLGPEFGVPAFTALFGLGRIRSIAVHAYRFVKEPFFGLFKARHLITSGVANMEVLFKDSSPKQGKIYNQKVNLGLTLWTWCSWLSLDLAKVRTRVRIPASAPSSRNMRSFGEFLFPPPSCFRLPPHISKKRYWHCAFPDCVCGTARAII
jgi:hypothetical protein